MDAPDRDLELLRAFRAADAVPPAGLLDRLQEDLQRTIDLDAAATGTARGGLRATPATASHPLPWWRRLARPAMVAGAAAGLALVMGVVGALGDHDAVGTTGLPSSTQAGAGLLDGTARTLFGASASAAPPLAGSIDAREPENVEAINAVTSDDAAGARDLVLRLPRDPARLATLVRDAADQVRPHGAAGDRVAFLLTMRLVLDDTLPSDLRAALLRSLDAVDGMDRALNATDALGRDGVLLSHFDAVSGVRDQFLLARDGGTLREQRSFTTAYVDPACPPGTFTAFELRGDDGAVLTPAQVPLLDWPQVVPACDATSSH